MIINTEQVLNFLPHRDPFLFIDSVEKINIDGKDVQPGANCDMKSVVGSSCLANYRTRKEHSIFKGHFPDYPILPGVVQVEMMAQSASFMMMAFVDNPFEIKLDVALLGVESAKFRKPIFPEMDLKITSKCIKTRGPFMSFECKIEHNNELMSEATVLASVKIK